MSRVKVKYVSDADGNAVEVILPISAWRRIASASGVAALLDEDGVSAASDRFEDAPGTRIGADPVSGLPVFITPPGSPVLTMDDVKRAEDDG